MSTAPQRLPAALWGALQEMCRQQDIEFIADVSRILRIPVADIKKRILGTRGVCELIPVEHGPWWTNTQCPVMEKIGGSMWRRCDSPCEQGDTCWAHRMCGAFRRYDDPYFVELPKRYPMRYEGVVYWVGADGQVMNGFGSIVSEFTMDLNTKTVFKTNGALGAIGRPSLKHELGMDAIQESNTTQEAESAIDI